MVLGMPIAPEWCSKFSCLKSSESDSNEESELVRLIFGLAMDTKGLSPSLTCNALVICCNRNNIQY